MKLIKLKSLITAALCAVGLSSFAAEPEAVQLWEGGPYFATYNVGATKPEEYGYYFWWGDTVGYYHDRADNKWVSVKDGTTSILFQYGSPLIPFHTEEAKILANYELPMALVDYVDADGNLKPDHDAATAHLGTPWRMMTKAEVDQLIANCDVVWTDDWNNTGVKGSIVKGRGDYAANSVFFPAAGHGYDSNLVYDGMVGYYWSSTWDDKFTDNVWGLYLSSGYNSRTYPAYYYGYSVRAVRDTAPVTEPSVTVGEVTSGEPWSTITVNYTLAGVDAKFLYKVVFDVTAGGQTASVTNAAAKLTDGAQEPKVIDTVQLFGKQVADTKAKVKISLIAMKPKADLGGVQLWKDGPFFAECNVGATVPGDYGDLYTSKDDKAKNAAESLGAGWRLPKKDELWDHAKNCTSNLETCKDSNGAEIKGVRFTGNTDGYTGKSIFLPLAGYDYDGTGWIDAGDSGYYWTSDVTDDYGADCFVIDNGGYASVSHYGLRSNGYSVRAVR